MTLEERARALIYDLGLDEDGNDPGDNLPIVLAAFREVRRAGRIEGGIEAEEAVKRAGADAEEARAIVRDLFPQESGEGLRSLILGVINARDKAEAEAAELRQVLHEEGWDGVGPVAFQLRAVIQRWQETRDANVRAHAAGRREGLLRAVEIARETPRMCGGSGEARGKMDPITHAAHSDAHDNCHEAIEIAISIQREAEDQKREER